MNIHYSNTTRISLIVAGFITLMAWPWSSAADTKRVTYNLKKPEILDVLAMYNVETCHSVLTEVKVRSKPKHGRLTIKKVMVKADSGQCKGRSIQVYGVVYQPKRGFKGADEATVGYRAPPRRSYGGSIETQPRSRKYMITVK